MVQKLKPVIRGEVLQMSDPTLSALASILRPVAQAAFKYAAKYASRLYAERKAGREPINSLLMESTLDQTLDRLRGGKIDDSWWRKILGQLGHQYITPDFLTNSVLQEWLADEHVASDLKVLAKTVIMSGSGIDPEIRGRLALSYSDRTGETSHVADGPIEVTVAILVAGYIASIPSDQRPATGMLQEMFGHFNERFDRLEETRLPALSDPIVRQAHTDQAEKTLSQILMLRALDPLRARRNIQELQHRVSDEGDLFAVSPSTKDTVLYWTARLCASDTETLDSARHLRDELRQTDPDRDLAIVDAMLAEGDGNTDEALRLLRDRRDPDSKTALFALLICSQSRHDALDWYAEQAAPDDGQFFTDVGWKNWAVCMAKVGRWNEAALHLLSFEPHWPQMPALALVEGIINAAMLLPDEYREKALETIPLYLGVTPTRGTGVEKHHSRASDCFEFAEQNLRDIADHDLAESISDWRRWLRLMDPNPTNANIVHDEIRQGMEESAQAVKLIPFAYAFRISFNVEPLRQYLEHRRQLGGLDDYEFLAESLLAEQSMNPHDLVSYLDQNKTRLSKVRPLAVVTTIHIDALVKDGQIEKARALIEAHATDLGEVHSHRLHVMIDIHEGKEPRKPLELLYHQTKEIIDLKNLVAYLKTKNDHVALQPLLHNLFDRERTVENAQDLAKCLGAPPSSDYEAIIKFAEENSDILEQSDELKGIQAWALFRVGRLQEAKEINDKLLSQMGSLDDLHLDINLVISSGEWERGAAILEREWPKRESHAPRTLIILAQLASQHGQTSTRALQLAKLAAEKAPNDPHILIAAYHLHVQLGHESDADPDWLKSAYDLSSADKGPIWSMNLQDVVTEWMPKRRDYLEEVERKWLSGEIPMSLATGEMNISFARLLLHIPDQNATKLDGRRRGILPIVTGGRNPVELQQDWTIGLDVTSIMILSYLGLLETAVESFHHVKLSPDIMEFLLRERDEVRFHQPSRIAAARQVRDLQNQGRLRVADDAAELPKALTDEVGLELSILLHRARQDNGQVICVLPIHRVGSLMEEQADTSEYDDLIHSPMDLCTLLHTEGRIAAADYQRASQFLNSQGQTAHAALSSWILQGPIYLDRTTLSYLQDAGMLQPMAATGLDIRIHPYVLEEMNALIGAGDIGSDLVTKIERIRDILRNAVDSGAASFLPRTTDQDEQLQKREIRLQATTSLVAGIAVCDALCIDDRFINRHPVLAEPPARSVPLVCVLDVLRSLVSLGRISVGDHWTARHKLRQGSFVFIPLESDELIHWLTVAKVEDGQLKESVELKTLRQTMAHIHSLSVLTPEETLALSINLHRVGKASIDRVWEDESLTIEQATMQSNWVWRYLMHVDIGKPQHIAEDRYAGWMRDLLSLRLGNLLLPTTIRSQERRAHYTRWLERFILDPLRPANADLIKKTLTEVCDWISSLENNQEMYGSLFLEQLPKAARRLVIAQDAEFARRCGFETNLVFSVGPDIKLVNSKLFAAAREVSATKQESVVQDVAGKDVLVDLQGDDQHVVVKWTDDEGVTQQAQVPDWALLSPNQEVRHDALGAIINRLGPTATDFRELLDSITSRPLTDQELAAIFEESTNGVTVVQARLLQKIQQDSSFNVTDLVPQSLSYFERFVGPNPNAQEPESYFRDLLVPYRTSLLNRDVQDGLDICCLGALRDDLTPGQWATDLADDVVWEALSSGHATSNPFSLLGALDVALYRQEDERFREFAATAVTTLLDERFGQQGGLDIYSLLQMLYEFVLNRLNLLENVATYPGYWRRMGAWMQAGLIARAMTESSSSINIVAFRQWLYGNMAAASTYADFVQARQEPMLLAGRSPLWKETLGRLYVLTSRHKREGRPVPKPEDISQILARTDERGQPLVSGLPGPLESHRRPTVPVPQEVTKKIGDTWTDGTDPSALHGLVTISQFFALGQPELERARETVKTLQGNNTLGELPASLRLLESASIVAAANRNAPLADGVADTVIRIAPQISTEEEIQIILRIMLQAAAAHEEHDAWFKWLEEGLVGIATHLSPPSNESLPMFLGHLGEIERMLSIDSWFHIRARAIALAGADTTRHTQ